MADNRWLGKALDVTQVDTITIANTWATSDTCTITIGGLDLVVTVGAAATTADVAAAVNAAINATNATSSLIGTETRNAGGREIPPMQELSSTVSGAVVTVTHAESGVSFTMTVAETTAGDGTATLATATTPTGKHWLTNADNWSDGVPTADDVLIFDSGNVSLKYGLTHLRSGTTVDSGTTDGTTASKLVDSAQNFSATVTVGDTVFNTTDSTEAVVTVVDSDTLLTLDTDIMVSGETYTIGTGIETAFTRTTDYTGEIGLPVQNTRGYKEYRQRQLQLYNRTADKEILFEQGANNGLGGRTWLDLDGQTFSNFSVRELGTSNTSPLLTITGGSGAAFFNRGSIAIDPDDATPTTPFAFSATSYLGTPGGQNRDLSISIGEGQHDGGSEVIIWQYSGVVNYFGSLADGASSTRVYVFGGTWNVIADTNIEVAWIGSGGVLNWIGAGDLAGQMDIYTGGTLDASNTAATRTYTSSILMYGGSTAHFVVEPSTVVFTGCTRDDCTITSYGSK